VQNVPRADAILLSRAARAEIEGRVRAAIREKDCGALVSFQPDNIAYISGLVLPFPGQYMVPRAAAILPADASSVPVVVLPLDWVQLPVQQNLNCKVVCYTAHSGLPPQGVMSALAAAVSAMVIERRKIGLDMGLCAQALLDTLFQRLPVVQWVDVTASLANLRRIKTEPEVQMLEEAVRQADRAMVSALNHSEGCVLDTTSYSLWEFTERIRVHIGEFGGSAAGHLTTLQGADMQIYSRAPRGNFVRGNLVRAEATSNHRGYWADMARTLYVGPADRESQQAYQDNLLLKNAVLKSIQPGTACNEVFQAAVRASQELGVEFWKEAGVGHGIGLAEREAPYLCPDDSTILEPGMVIVLAVYTYGPHREWVCSKDTYQVTGAGARLLSWYRNWDRLYCLMGNTARHG
jgi:Xaa-Pro aminopeptidase